MRVKKLLPLILLAVGALFLLSSCDAILDALYANNTINVAVTVYNSVHSPGYASPYSSVSVTLGGASGGTQSAYLDTYVPGSYGLYVLPPFKKLPNGSYTITTTYYDGSLAMGWQTVSFYDPGNNYTTSLSLPYGGSTTANVNVVFF